jgi:choline dehydrogenase-like flavoprotein
MPSEVHTIVVGGGTGGATCAGLLAAHGTESVLLLEAGPDYGPFQDGNWPRELLDARAIPLSHDWGLNSGDVYSHRVLEFPRARVMGGCSAHNCSATRRMAGYRRSDGRSQRGVMMAFPKVSDKTICRYSAVSRLVSLESRGLVAPRSAAARRR